MSQEAPARRGVLGLRVTTGPRARFRDLLGYLRDHRKALVLVVILSVVGAAASLSQPLLLGTLITRVEDGQELGWLIWALIFLVVFSSLVAGFQHYALQRTGTSVVLSTRRHLVARILRLPIVEFDQRRTGDLVSRVGTDTTLLYAVMTQGLLDAVGASLVFIGALIALFIIDPVLLSITLGVVLVSLVSVVLLSRLVQRASAEQQRKVGDLASAVERAISAIRTVRATNATEREQETINADAQGAWVAGVKVAKISAFVVPIASIALQVCMLIVLGVGGYRVASGAIDLSDLIVFVLFLFIMLAPLTQAFGAISSVNQVLGAVGRIQEIIDIPSETENDAAVVSEPPVETDAAVVFDQVRFAYPATAHKTEVEKIVAEVTGEDEAAEGQQREVLHGVSFTAPRGQRIALVGPSGAGKSTILALIERFYDVTGGVIRIGGADIRSLDREQLRAQIGYVEQDAPVLAGSIRDNLLLGSPGASDEDCIAVLRSVNLADVLERDEAGLDAAVGEAGVMLSGGERQRLAIARALLAAPPILLLDESTSSLDGLNERMLRDAIDAVAEDRTLIVIAHRLSTVVDSHKIVVFEKGEVVGTGTHAELVESTPLYAELAKHQLLV